MSGLRNRPCVCWSARCTDWRSWNSSVDPGDFTRTCMDAGAASLIGVDSSAEMLRHAPALRHVRYVHAAMETLERPPASVDLVYSSMALHFMEGVSDVFSRTAAWIRPGGHQPGRLDRRRTRGPRLVRGSISRRRAAAGSARRLGDCPLASVRKQSDYDGRRRGFSAGTARRAVRCPGWMAAGAGCDGEKPRTASHFRYAPHSGLAGASTSPSRLSLMSESTRTPRRGP